MASVDETSVHGKFVNDGHLQRLLQQVHRRAYEIFRDREAARIPGNEAEDWARAEREVLGLTEVFPRTNANSDRPMPNNWAELLGQLGSAPMTGAAAPRRIDEMTAADVMTQPVKAARPEWSALELATFFEGTGVTGAPVIAADGTIIGIVTTSDLVRLSAQAGSTIAQHLNPSPGTGLLRMGGAPSQVLHQMLCHSQIGHLAQKRVISAAPETPVAKLCEMMMEHGVHRIFIVAENKLVGVVSAFDIVIMVAAAAVSKGNTVPEPRTRA
jgi:CBS-domain-containing membrane protein